MLTLHLQANEKRQAQEVAAANRKRSPRTAPKEVTKDATDPSLVVTDADRSSRASRHKLHDNLGDAALDPTKPAAAVAPEAKPQESREDRLRKREEERVAREAAAERAQLAEVRRMEIEAGVIQADDDDEPRGEMPPNTKQATDAASYDEAWYFDCEICGMAGWNLVSFSA